MQDSNIILKRILYFLKNNFSKKKVDLNYKSVLNRAYYLTKVWIFCPKSLTLLKISKFHVSKMHATLKQSALCSWKAWYPKCSIAF